MNATSTPDPDLVKKASIQYPINRLLAERWSPCGFSDRPVPESDLGSLFEAARWAASSYNEQPWRYLVATKNSPEEFQRLLSCLVPANQDWAQTAPVLALGVVSLKFSKTKKDNHAAVHDLGLASATLTVEATARGLSVHQMIGILPERAREIYQIPPDTEAWTALAIGYRVGTNEFLSTKFPERDLQPRQRKPFDQFVFTGSWGRPFLLETPSES